MSTCPSFLTRVTLTAVCVHLVHLHGMQWECQLRRLRKQLEHALVRVPVDLCLLVAEYAMPECTSGRRSTAKVTTADYDEQRNTLWYASAGQLRAVVNVGRGAYQTWCYIPRTLWQPNEFQLAIGSRYGLIVRYHKALHKVKFLRFPKHDYHTPYLGSTDIPGEVHCFEPLQVVSQCQQPPMLVHVGQDRFLLGWKTSRLWVVYHLTATAQQFSRVTGFKSEKQWIGLLSSATQQRFGRCCKRCVNRVLRVQSCDVHYFVFTPPPNSSRDICVCCLPLSGASCKHCDCFHFQ